MVQLVAEFKRIPEEESPVPPVIINPVIIEPLPPPLTVKTGFEEFKAQRETFPPPSSL